MVSAGAARRRSVPGRARIWSQWCFDCDDTLLDSRRRFADVHRRVMRRLGRRPVRHYAAQRRAGVSEMALCRQAGLDADGLARYLAERQRAFDACTTPLCALPAAARLLAALRRDGIAIAVVSNRTTTASMARDLRCAGLLALVSRCYATKPLESRVPSAPTSCRESVRGDGAMRGDELTRIDRLTRAKADVLRRLARSGPTVMVGDSDTDILAARLAGVSSIGVATGWCSARRLGACGADRVYPSLVALYGSIARHQPTLSLTPVRINAWQ